MDPLSRVVIERASSALNLIRDASNMDECRAAAIEYGLAAMIYRQPTDIIERLSESDNERIRGLVTRADVHSLVSAGAGTELATMFAAILESHADGSLLDTILGHGSNRVGDRTVNYFLASGFVVDSATEGAPKAVENVGLEADFTSLIKPAALVVMSDDLARLSSAGEVFERELVKSVTRAVNAAVLGFLIDSSTVSLTSAGTAIADLRAALQASVPSAHYTVAADHGRVAELVCHEANQGLGIAGGAFRPGVNVVPVEGLNGLIAIPTSRVTVRDMGLSVRPSREANIDLAGEGSPTVSMFQKNLKAILAERSFALRCAAPIVSVEAGS